jgi:O-antigen/teichoic acid export membrane protein
VVWTTGTYAFSVIIRFGSNVILARLLSPELFGALIIINTIRQGVELSSDLGLAQNVVQNKAGGRPEFYNTVWAMQIVRGTAIGLILFLCSGPIANLYSLPISAFQISAAILIVAGLASTSIFLLHRNMQLAKLNLFDLAQDGIGAAVLVAAALISPTVESLLAAVLLSQIIRSVWSHFLATERNEVQFNKFHAWEILIFGRWIFLASILTFLCASFDRLYIGKVAPLAVVGVYGIARTLADIPTMLAARIGYSVIFPTVSSAQGLPRADIRKRIAGVRFRLLLAAALAIACGITISDAVVKVVYDARYHDAAWMLPLLLFGVWLAVLCAINEFVMLGIGRPLYNVAGNTAKLLFFLSVLPLAYRSFGIIGAVLAIALSEIGRYCAFFVGQRRERLSFFRQDVSATIVFLVLVGGLSWIRSAAGFGTPFDNAPFQRILGLQ